ncbi:hypothetical protein EZV73_18615 [Acidaminobacter sp. JC074]|uniref:hypothetical protein n=1 Tax=Acidaminobacter sp. JC074 TaxID=2530199 RepID=UPI001F0E9BBE|nr:hypothetical protein [Acidaminobacter sp. JC074]MCH4889602.1 hypothetical protein [Acidaminobacter sp. JC074]
MNKKHVSQVSYLGQTTAIDPDKPFVLTFDDGAFDIKLYDANGDIVKIDQFSVPVSSGSQLAIELSESYTNEANLFIEYGGIYYNSLSGPSSYQEVNAFDNFIKTTRPSELVENQLNELTVKAGFTLRMDFEQAPISYEVYSWYEPDVYDQVLVKDGEFTVSSHRPSEIYLVKASYDFGEKYFVFKVDIVDYYTVVPDVIYHVLEEEYLDNTYEDHSRFTRIYWTYDGIKDEFYPSTVVIAIDKVETLLQARDYLKSNHLDDIMFLENTLVSNGVINQWLLEGYQPDVEYHSKSKKGLTYKEIKELN